MTRRWGILVAAGLAACGGNDGASSGSGGSGGSGGQEPTTTTGSGGAGGEGAGGGDVERPVIVQLQQRSSPRYTCALIDTGEVFCGEDAPLTELAAEGMSQISIGTGVTDDERFGCALDAAGQVWCWGANTRAQQGLGTEDETTFHPVHPVDVPASSVIAAGANHACSLTLEGTVWCWGDNFWGQLGRGFTSLTPTLPAPVPGLDEVVRIWADGTDHQCAERSDGTIWCWGNNNFGAVGIDDTDDVTIDTPTLVAYQAPLAELSLSARNIYFLAADGGLSVTGNNWGGAFGNGFFKGVDAATPVTIAAITDAQHVHAFTYGACVVHADGGVSCWGGGQWEPHAPVRVLEPGAIAPAAVKGLIAGHRTCAVLTDDRVLCWDGACQDVEASVEAPCELSLW